MATVLMERDGATLLLGMNRPDKKNALTAEMYQGLADGLRAADDDDGVKAIVVHGVAGAFTAGNDLQDFLMNPPSGSASPVFQFLMGITHARKPLIAAVDGVAVGIGTTMLLHCDFVYATAESRFVLPFVNLGICPEAASSFLLPLAAGYQRAAKLLLLGEPFGVTEAKEAGILTDVVSAAQLLDTARATARKLGERPTSAIRITKALLKRQYQASIEAAIAEENTTFVRMLGEPAAKEALSAFVEKRKPDFAKIR